MHLRHCRVNAAITLVRQLSLKSKESPQNRLHPYSGVTLFVTTRVRSTREGTVFTGVCLSTSRGGVPTFQVEGYHLPRSGLGGGVPTFPGLDRGGTHLPRQGGVPTLGSTYLGGGGYLP